MSIKTLTTDFDLVITSKFVTGITSYGFAIEHLIPLIARLDIQRNLQDSRFYQRLERDLITGCIMPPITIAFIDENPNKIGNDIIEKYINDRISSGFILDGIQRLNTLNRTYLKNDSKLKLDRNIYLNILICSSMDNLLYRMITLNNGQKPMSARHQIEILTNNLVEFQPTDIPIVTEKTKKSEKLKVAFAKDSFIKGYLAFLSNSTNIENKKIIEEKMDQLIADKIMDTEIKNDTLQFSDVVNLINKISQSPIVFKWLKNENNLIGFCVGIRHSINEFINYNNEDIEYAIENYERAFSSFNYSQIKVGKYRRDLGSHYIHHIKRMRNMDELELVDELSQID